MATFHHYGVPSATVYPEANFIAGAGVHVTDALAHPYRIEFLRWEADSQFPEVLQKNTHVAFLVENLDKALEGKEVIVPPFDATDKLRCAFIAEGDAYLELMEEIG